MPPLSAVAALGAACLMAGSAAYAAVLLRPTQRSRSGPRALTVLAVSWSLAALLVAVAFAASMVAA